MERLGEIGTVRERGEIGSLPPHDEIAALRRTANRYSLCFDDAEDAVQRAIEILLRRPPELEPANLGAWIRVVIRHEALRVRRERERLLGGCEELEALQSERLGPAERAERREGATDALRALGTLKPHEQRAIVLQAQGYSYAEICALTGWTYTKVNRCLAEGRARLRSLTAGRG